ncbi:MAG: Uma2 family endonuclease, partial [Fimbriimonadales bacterium]|nr:Uma2 family endonuclease [Fimbriimonadales bacterium]
MEQVIYAETRTPPQYKVSFEEFLEWLEEDTHAEWIDGEVVLKMPVSVEHQKANSFLYQIVSAWVNYHRTGEAHHPPLLVGFTLSDGKHVAREPDIVVILNSNSGAFTEQYFEGVPDLIVEVVSPKQRNVDRLVKFEEYESAGVPE